MCVSVALPCLTLGTSAAGTQPDNSTGTVLYEQNFGTATTDITKFNSGKYASWKILSGTATTLKSEGGVLKVTPSSDLLLQIFGGTEMNTLAKSQDYTISFDMKYTAGSTTNYVGVQLDRADANNYIEVAVRLRGDGYMKAFSGGTGYSLEDDGVKASLSEVQKGTSSVGHKLHSLCKIDTATADNTYEYTDQNGVVRRTYPTTLLTLLNRTDSTISDTFNKNATPLNGKKLSYRIESIHGAGVIVSINGVVVSTTIKNVYYYDQLTAKSGTVALFFQKGISAEIDNLKLVSGGAYTVTTNSLGIKVMTVNTLFSNRGNNFSMHWLVDENGKLRMEALLDVIALQDPDIIGFQERTYTHISGSGAENDIVEALIAMGYGVVNNKMRNNSNNPTDANPDGTASRYDSYNNQPIFYKTSKFIMMNNSSREDEYTKGGLSASEALDEQIANGLECFTDMFCDIWPKCDYSESAMSNVQLLIGDQAKSIDTTKYQAVSVRYIGRITGYGNPQKTVTELRYQNADPTVIKPVTVSNTSGWLNVSTFDDTEFAKVTYNTSTKKVVYNGKSYTGAYYRRGVTEPLAVLLTNNPVKNAETGATTTPSYVTDSNAYRAFYSEIYTFDTIYYPNGYTQKYVAELRTKGSASDHTDMLPITLTHEQLLSGKYLDATHLTQAEYNSIEFKKDGTTAAVYKGVSYDGVYYVRNRSTANHGKSDSKAVCWSVLRMRENGQQILMMNTHAALIHSGAEYRSDGVLTWVDSEEWRISNAKQSIEVMKRVFEKFGEMPVIFTGDFNMGNSDPMYTYLSEYFEDTARLAPNTVYWEYSHHEPLNVIKDTGKKDKYGNSVIDYSDMSARIYPLPGYPIDHIFVSTDDFEVNNYNVLNDTPDELHMTDHCALVSELTIKGVATPGCSHENGIYRTAQRVTLTKGNAEDIIYYTLDGSDPATSATRRICNGTIRISGDTQLRAKSYRGGVYSGERVVNFAQCAEIAITEIMPNPNGADVLEGFEVVNVSKHSVDLADYLFWQVSDASDPDALSDENATLNYNTSHLRVQEKGKYIMQPGEVFFIWVVMSDTYKYKLEYGAGQSAYAVDYVTAEGLANKFKRALWRECGYSLTEDSTDAIGKTIYRTDLVAAALEYQLGCKLDKSQIVPLEVTSSTGIFPIDGSEGYARKDLAYNQTSPRILGSAFNLGNSVFSRYFISYEYEPDPKNSFFSATLDNRHGADITVDATGTVVTGGIKIGSYTFTPTSDAATGRITAVATAFNAWNKKTASFGKLTTEQEAIFAKMLSKVTFRYADGTVQSAISENGAAVTLPAGDAAAGAVFCGWKTEDGKLYAVGKKYVPEGDETLEAVVLNFATVAGASIRTTTGSTGLRFTTEIDKAGYDALSGLVGELQVGTFIVPQSYVESAGGYNIAKFAKYLDIPARAWYKEDGETYTLAGSIANIFEKNYNRAFTGCGYLKFTCSDGTEALIYASLPANSSRTVVEVARAAYNDRAETASAAYPYLTADGNYSRYTEKQMDVIHSFFIDPLYIRYDGTNFVATGSSTEMFTWEYNDNADTVTLIRPAGGKWRISGLYLDGVQITDYTVNGDRIVFRYSFYSERY